jgi:hypothetical protein
MTSAAESCTTRCASKFGAHNNGSKRGNGFLQKKVLPKEAQKEARKEDNFISLSKI